MPFNIGPFELLLVLILALLILGPGKLPEVGNALGKTIREFRKASTDVEEAVRIEPQSSTATAATPATPVAATPVNTVADTSSDTATEDRTAS